MPTTTITVTVPNIEVEHLTDVAINFTRRINQIFGTDFPDPTADAQGKAAFEALLAQWMPHEVKKLAREYKHFVATETAGSTAEDEADAWLFGDGL